jgi:hypothetical protein
MPEELKKMRSQQASVEPEKPATITERLIPAHPPREAIEVRRRRTNDPDHYHRVANPSKGEKRECPACS